MPSNAIPTAHAVLLVQNTILQAEVEALSAIATRKEDDLQNLQDLFREAVAEIKRLRVELAATTTITLVDARALPATPAEPPPPHHCPYAVQAPVIHAGLPPQSDFDRYQALVARQQQNHTISHADQRFMRRYLRRVSGLPRHAICSLTADTS